MRKLTVNPLGEIVDRRRAHTPTLGLLGIGDLTVDERRFVRKVWELQKLNNGRFNVWGRIRKDGRPLIRLETEFRERLKERAWWRAFRRQARSIGLQVEGQFAHWKEGRLVTLQVAGWLDITRCSLAAARQERRRIAKGTEAFWKTNGVAVI
jgi:hypothetical protein